MTRDVLDPAHEFEKVPVKEESKVGKVPVKQKSKSEKVPVIKKSENEEAIPSYRQLNEWLAAMTANEHVKDRDEKKDQLSPQFEKGLPGTGTSAHWPRASGRGCAQGAGVTAGARPRGEHRGSRHRFL